MSIGNILAAKESFSCKKAFHFDVEALLASIPSGTTTHLGSDEALAMQKNQFIARIRKIAEDIKEVLLHINLTKKTKAFIMDFDLAANWQTYFNEDHSKGSISVGIFPPWVAFYYC